MKSFAVFKMISRTILCAIIALSYSAPIFAVDAVVSDCCEGINPGDANKSGEVDMKESPFSSEFSQVGSTSALDILTDTENARDAKAMQNILIPQCA